jgi:hypothetical protein
VKKKDATTVTKPAAVKKSRNEYATKVFGISAPNKFWEVVWEYAVERGLTRSAALVELVQRGIGKKAPPASEAVGRPRKKTVKSVSK